MGSDMKSQELEDLTLLLVRDAAAGDMWLDRWAVSYPTVRLATVSATPDAVQWQQQLASAMAGSDSRTVAVVAHGAGVAACLAWLYAADINRLGQLRALLLAAPLASHFVPGGDAPWQRVRVPCPTAWVLGQMPDPAPAWAVEQAGRIGARLLQAPQPGSLDGPLNGWQWGMKLLQEMLLA